LASNSKLCKIIRFRHQPLSLYFSELSQDQRLKLDRGRFEILYCFVGKAIN